MSYKSEEVKPFLRQCLVTAGVSLCMMEHGLVASFIGILIPQLRKDSSIILDKDKISWIASIHSISLFIGALMTPFIMCRHGRRKANLICAIIMIVGWICVCLAPNTNVILLGRFVQGLALGISSLSASILVGEYTSPKYRGAFLSTMTLTILTGTLFIHTLGSFMDWRTASLICLGITVMDLIVILMSPETPVFLATKGRYDECRKMFHWLRGLNEDKELEDIIKTNMLYRETTHKKSKKVLNKINDIMLIIKDPKFFKPLIVMLHMDIVNVWCGGLIMDVYASDIYSKVIGNDVNVAAIMLISDCVRIISSSCAVFIHKQFNRRPMLLLLVSLNVIAYFLIAVRSYLIDRGTTMFLNHQMIGTVLVNFHIVTTVIGSQSLANTLAGEIFPLRYKGIDSMISIFFLSANLSVQMKTFPYLLSYIGLSYVFCLYSGITAYGMIVTAVMMPETKGKTLLSIEKFWNKSVKETNLIECTRHEDEQSIIHIR